jgi:predicted nucleic acid-binding protein
MILVDASVWIDFFRGSITRETDELARLLEDAAAPLAIADLTLYEVLRGFSSERDFIDARRLLTALDVIDISGADSALAASSRYRALRRSGHTNNSTVDVVLASFCIEQGHALLHSDADFDAFESLQGLKVWRGPAH